MTVNIFQKIYFSYLICKFFRDGERKGPGKKKLRIGIKSIVSQREKKANEPGEKTSEMQINKTINRYTMAGLGIEPRTHWRDPIVLNIVESY